MRPYLESVGMVGLVTLVGQPVHVYLDPTNLVMLYLLGIVLVARRWGQGPSILASLLSVLAFDIFFVPPYFTLAVADAEYLVSFAGFLVVGLVISALTARARTQTQVVQQQAAQITATHALSHDLAEHQAAVHQAAVHQVAVHQVAVHQVAEILQTVIDQAMRSVDVEAAVFLSGSEGLVLRCASPGYKLDLAKVPSHMALADYFPLRTARDVIGMLAIQHKDRLPLSSEQRHLLEAVATQAAFVLERAGLIDQS